MNKKVLSVILLCFIAISFLLTFVLFVNTGISIYKLKNIKVDSSNEMLPSASVLGWAFATLATWLGFVSLAGLATSVGLILSFINIKIALNPIIKRISLVSLYVNCVILILLIGILVYGIVVVF